MVVWNDQLPCRGIRGQDHFAALQINRVNPPADEFRAAEAAAQGRADVAGLQGASSHFRQHWRKQQRVSLTDQRDRRC